MECSECGFEAVDSCQMDIDHMDGNHLNWSPQNLRALCANCHRLKTKRNGDHLGLAYLKQEPSPQLGFGFERAAEEV